MPCTVRFFACVPACVPACVHAMYLLPTVARVKECLIAHFAETPPETFSVTFRTTAGDFTIVTVTAWAPPYAQRFWHLARSGSACLRRGRGEGWGLERARERERDDWMRERLSRRLSDPSYFSWSVGRIGYLTGAPF